MNLNQSKTTFSIRSVYLDLDVFMNIMDTNNTMHWLYCISACNNPICVPYIPRIKKIE